LAIIWLSESVLFLPTSPGLRHEPDFDLVEELKDASGLRVVAQPCRVLLGFAAVLAHDLREVDAIAVEIEHLRRDLSRHGPSGPGRTPEQNGWTAPVPRPAPAWRAQPLPALPGV
jgi:hypothetical protein